MSFTFWPKVDKDTSENKQIEIVKELEHYDILDDIFVRGRITSEKARELYERLKKVYKVIR
jgi:hypothetical protein